MWQRSNYDPLGEFAYEQLSLSTTVSSLTAATFLNAKLGILSLEGDSARFREDGTAPTTAVGEVLVPGDVLAVYGSADLHSFQIVGQSANAKLNCRYSY